MPLMKSIIDWNKGAEKGSFFKISLLLFFFSLFLFLTAQLASSRYLSRITVKSEAADNNGGKPANYIPGAVIVKIRSSRNARLRLKGQARPLGKKRVSFSKIDPQTVPAALKKINRIHQIKALKKILERKEKGVTKGIYSLQFDQAASVKELVRQLQNEEGVEYAEPDYIGRPSDFPNDPAYLSGQQWSLDKIEALESWKYSNGNGVTIAVLDTGVDSSHPDLAGRILPGFSFTTDNEDVSDPCNHGTHVTGIIAADTNNGIGIAGISFNSKILPVKVMDRYQPDSGCYGSYSDFARGLIYATDHGAAVVNMSFGGPAFSYSLQDAIDYAQNQGVLLVAAAGNSNSSSPFYPAYYNEVMAVAATTFDDQRAGYSNFGNWIDIAAPGSSIYSLLPNSSYAYMSGTSMASPHVVGVAGLILAVNSSLLHKQNRLKSILISTADDLGKPGRDDYFGHGRLNAAAAVKKAMRTTDIVEVTKNIKISESRNDHTQLEYSNGNYVDMGEKTPLYIGIRSNGNRYYTVLRFTNVDIPKGAMVKEAYLDLSPAWWQKREGKIIIAAEKSANSQPIGLVRNGYQIKDLPRFSQQITWEVGGSWGSKGYKESPDLASLLQKIIDAPGWQKGNSITLILQGEGNYWAFDSYDTRPSEAAELIVDYKYDDEFPGPIPTPTPTAAPTPTPTPIVSPTPIPTPGEKTLTLKIQKKEDDTYQMYGYLPRSPNYLRIGHVYQAGFRFENVKVPAKAKILEARLKIASPWYYQGKESSVPVCGEKTGNSTPLPSRDLRSRETTSCIDWKIKDPWPSKVYQETPDLKDIIQTIVNLPEWQEGNALSIITKENYKVYWPVIPYEANPQKAAQLVIRYQTQ
jgi:thermitase